MKHILSLGAGVQSSALALMATASEIEPMPDAAIFADTESEPQSVYDWLDWLEPRLPFPVYRVSAGSLERSALEMKTTTDGRLYSRTAVPVFTQNTHTGEVGKVPLRTCTRDYKIRPIIKQTRRIAGRDAIVQWRREQRANLDQWNAYQDYLTQAAKARTAAKKAMPVLTGEPIARPPARIPFPAEAWAAMQSAALVCQWIGISLDEITRAKPSREPWIRHRHPLIEKRLDRQACLDWMADRGYPPPPRSACYFCPFHSLDEWRRLRDDEPAEFARAVEFERTLQDRKGRSANRRTVEYLSRYCVPLDQLELDQPDDQGGLLWTDECEGMCGV